MASNMTTIALVLLGALTANAANLRSNSSGSFPVCPQGGWTYNTVTGNCYKLWPKLSIASAPAPGTTIPVLKALQYDHAKKVCKQYGAYIAVPNTDAEMTFIRTFFGKDRYFIGFDSGGLSEGFFEDGTNQTQSSSFKKIITKTSGSSDRTMPPAGSPVALRKSDNTLTNTGKEMKPVVSVSSTGSWMFKSKTEDLPFLCELTYCKVGCNTKEKAPGTKDSADTIVRAK